MSSEPNDEQRHRVMNVLAAILVNAQLLEAAFDGESPDEPLLASQPREARVQALTAVRHIVQSSQALAALLAKR